MYIFVKHVLLEAPYDCIALKLFDIIINTNSKQRYMVFFKPLTQSFGRSGRAVEKMAWIFFFSREKAIRRKSFSSCNLKIF